MRSWFVGLAAFGLALASCKNTTSLTGGAGAGDTGGSGGTGGTGGTTAPLPKVGKVDLLFSIDNSRSMADKQQILSLALGDLISGLANPPCLDTQGNQVASPGGLTPCPEGSQRQFEPVNDIHIGIVSSSLGGHGSDACSTAGAGKASNDDEAHLLSRIDPQSSEQVPTYQNMGFLAWDPTVSLDPPGEADQAALVDRFRDMVLGVGQIGCGYESQLESWYRFLVQPDPPLAVVLDARSHIVWQGIDTVLLDQRKAFLRPDSMLVVVMMSDENDCSIAEQGQYYLVAQQVGMNGSPFHLPRARAACEVSPSDPCCFSCGQTSPVDENGDPLCPEDPSCDEGDGSVATHTDLTDHINLRCFDQKRRFGIDFLYPIERYVNGLAQGTITDRNGAVHENPLFVDLDPSDDVTTVRDQGLVLLTGIVGVPWQDIAKNPQDLKQGFKTSGELTQPNADGHTVWEIILGDPAASVPPLDPFMRESPLPRDGTNPVTGDSITTPGDDNSINGHDFPNPDRDDLQFACIMPIPEPRDCVNMVESCDCSSANNSLPLCGPNPNDGDNPTLQIRAKAYPGLRQLAVLEGLGERAVIGSICAAQIADPDLPDYAYRPAVSSLIDRMKLRLK